jgi:hypothetical protein
MQRHHQCRSKFAASDDIESFLNNIRVTNTGGKQQGTTWLELYILFRLMGYGKPVRDRQDKARSRSTVRQQLDMFKKATRAVVERIYIGTKVKPLFSPNKFKGEPLAAFAISGNQAMVNFRVAISEDLKTHIGEQLLTLGHKCTKMDLKQIQAGTLRVPPRKLKLCGRAGWDSHLPIVIRIPHKHHDFQDHDPPSSNHNSTSMVFFSCSQCKGEGKERGDTAAFQLDDIDKKVRCTKCRQSSAVKTWSCPCGLLWHLCPLHQHHPLRLRASGSGCEQSSEAELFESAQKNRRKRTIVADNRHAPAPCDDKLMPKRRKTEKYITLIASDKVRSPGLFLGPALQQRFPHL